MNSNLRPTLWAALAAMVMMIWLQWNAANQPQPVQPTVSQTMQDKATASGVPTNDDADVATIASTNIANATNTSDSTSGKRIHIKTDVLDLVIDTQGGTIVESKLLEYTTSIKDKTPIQLFSSNKGKLYHLETGINANTHTNNATHSAVFHSEKDNYEMTGDSLSVPLIWQADGVTVIKTFTFHRGRYDFNVTQRIENNSGKEWVGYQYMQLKQNEVKVARGPTTFNTFAGAVYSTPEKKYEKLSFSDLSTAPIKANNIVGGWVGFMQHYFLGAIIPDQASSDTFFSRYDNNDTKDFTGDDFYYIGTYSKPQIVTNGSSLTFNSRGFVGPKIKDELAKVAPNLDKAMDYGPIFFVSEFLFNVLDLVNSIVKNWGWAIVIVTIGIKTILFPLAAKSFKSMAKMRKFQPEMDRIRKNYGDDRQLSGKKMMELYKKEGINPASGCLPILIQIPIFLAFYYMLMESVELRQAPWIFWIKDLSIQDPFYVLPVLNMALMFLQQQLNPPRFPIPILPIWISALLDSIELILYYPTVRYHKTLWRTGKTSYG